VPDTYEKKNGKQRNTDTLLPETYLQVMVSD